ncbi:MAG TPA: nucleotidyl transferase AbiEii/AbiGii toxin family protein [Solirubrobacteraceae bacterium]|nr:nucleotidyl transferase AbiEii/AbiGii toxin family protein [Solirubrobacteraceae bacterium]
MTELPPKNPPKTLNRLQQLITELAKQSGLPVRRLNMRVASMMLAGALSRLVDEEGQPKFLTKGGIAIELRLLDRARASQDVDIVMVGDAEELADHLEEVFSKPYEGFSFIAGEPEALRARPEVRRLQIQVSFNTKRFTTLQVEFAPTEAGCHEFDELPGHDLSKLGLNGPDRVPVLALRWQIAQKLHAVSETPLQDGRENVRFWDLIDLQLLEAVTIGELSIIREACEETFALRAKHTWPPEIAVYPSWSESYTAMARNLEMPITDVEEAAAAVTAFIARIEAG